MTISAAKATRAMKWGRLGFRGVDDGRKARGTRHAHEGLLRLAVAALAAGARTLRAVEAFGEDIGSRGRRFLSLKKAPSDTCQYDLLSKQTTKGFAEELVGQVKTALEQKVIGNDLFPVGVIAIDGKECFSGDHEAIPEARRTDSGGAPVWYVMAQRACLVSSSARPVVHQRLIAADAGEADTFPATYAFLCEQFGRSFEFVSYDAGGTSRSNAKLVNDSQRGYWFAVKGNQPTVHRAARSRLGCHAEPGDAERAAQGRTSDRAKGAHVVREAFGGFIDKDDPEIDFAGARQIWRIRQTSRWTDDAGSVKKCVVEDRYFLTNRVVSAENALRLARLHWGIENGANWTMDVVLGEDDGTVCTRGVAVEVWSWLRLLAYNLVSFWRRKLPRVHGETPSWERALNTLRDAFRAIETSFAFPV